MGPDTADLVAGILNSWYLVRHYERGGRSSIGRTQREQAIQKLGLTVRDAFNKSEDFEPLLAAILDGGRPHHQQPF